MEPERLGVGALMLIACVLILTLPRQKIIMPFLLAFFSIPIDQVVLVGGLHFPVQRVLIVVALIRRAMTSKSSTGSKFPGGFNGLDAVVILWTVSQLVVNSLQWLELQAFVKLAGDFLDAFGGYLVVRFLIDDNKAIARTLKVFALVCLIQGVCMVSEQVTHRNVFDFMGGHPPTDREGHIRSEGALGTLYGGTLAGVLVPMFLWLWNEKQSRMWAYTGLAGATAMVFASHASTSWVALGSGIMGLGFWPLRKVMRLIRWGIVFTLVGLHLVMHGPVWSLIEKIDLTGGSSNYHRYMLVDNCIRHFSDWWLLGYKHPGNWGFDMWDMCNQFVAVAVSGGLISLILYITIFSRGFAAIGNTRRLVEGNTKQEWLIWSLGATLFANVVASFGINYMLQLLLVFFPILAFVSVATSEAKQFAVQTTPAIDKIRLPGSPVRTSSLPLKHAR